jgi:hypothetical protein
MGRILSVHTEDDKIQKFFVRESEGKILLQKHRVNNKINIASII